MCLTHTKIYLSKIPIRIHLINNLRLTQLQAELMLFPKKLLNYQLQLLILIIIWWLK